ncbi:hypothetical protein BDR26DRAFT_891750 [Obelidium mucronatum]|nr:hypothetical protein BDR26DRAFT_891750 [Obelidium mucronatum]
MQSACHFLRFALDKRSANVVFAPYLDATTDYDPTPYFKSTGTNHYTLAFVTADKSGNPQWNGYSVTSKFYADKIATIRAFGGDVSISFGGAAGTELALVAKDAATLAATYLSVLNTYNVNWADFDVEGGAISNTATVDMRNQAIAIMQAKQPNIKISYTLPVTHTGLAASGINVINSAVRNNARVDVLNIMTMDYYENIPYVDANGKSLMGQYAISATQGTYSQVGSKVGSIGICPMIGINDDVKEIFTVADATQVANFAAATSYVSWVSFWVVEADLNGNSDGKGAASGAYAKAILAGLGGGQPGTTTTTTTTTTKAATTTTKAPASSTTTTTTTTTKKPTTTTTASVKTSTKTTTTTTTTTKAPATSTGTAVLGSPCTTFGAVQCVNKARYQCAYYNSNSLTWGAFGSC